MSKHSHTTHLFSKLAGLTTHRRPIAVFVVVMALLVMFSGTVSAHDLDTSDWSSGNFDDTSSVMATGSQGDNELKVRKYNDLDNNGDRNSDEPYLSGWSFVVYNILGQVAASGETNSSGRVEFDLDNGLYKVCEVAQEGWENTEPGGEPDEHGRVCTGWFYLNNDKTIEFGNHELPPAAGSLHVYKFNDIDGDGEQGDGEEGLNDWEFTLTGEDDEFIVTTMNHPDTNEPGWAWFTDIPLGDYLLCETPQDDWEVTTPNAALDDNCIEVEIAQVAATEIPGGNFSNPNPLTTGNGDSFRIEFLGTSNGGLTWDYRVTELGNRDLSHWVLGLCDEPVDWSGPEGVDDTDFGVDPSTGVNGFKWDDLDDDFDDDGDDDDDTGIFSVTFEEPYGATSVQVGVKSGGFPRSGQVRVGTITGPNCEPREVEYPVYVFGNQEQEVCEPQDHLDAELRVDIENGTATSWITNSSSSCEYEVGMISYQMFDSWANDPYSQIPFDWEPPVGDLGTFLGGVNGTSIIVPPGGEVNLTVDLPDCAAQVDVVFDANHLADSVDQPTELDQVPLLLPAFYTNSYGPYGNRYGGSLANRLLAATSTHATDDVPYCVNTGSLHVFKFHDVDGDRRHDDDEPGLNGWTFTLIGEGGSFEVTTMNHPETNEPGWAWFTNVPEGDYELCEVVQEGWEITAPHDARQDDCIDVTVEAGGEVVYEFGNRQRTGTLKVLKYHDLSNNGEYDFLEPGLNGWWIVVYDSEGNEVARQQTHTIFSFFHSTHGWAIFELPVGEYEVCEEPTEAQLDWINTDPGGERPCEWVEIRANRETKIDFGNLLRGQLHVQKYNDRNGNGHRDDGDESLSGWTIQIYSIISGDGILTYVTEAVTDEDGWVWFTLNPGLYKVCEVEQDGWENTDPGGPLPCELVLILPGETDYRFFGNHALTGSITIVKDTQPDNGRNFTFEGTDPIGEFTLDDDGGNNADFSNSATFTELEYGEYTITETGNFGEAWGLGDIYCEGAVNTTFDIDVENNNVTIDLAPGEDVTCTFVNQRTPRIRVRKYEDLNRNGNRNGGQGEDWLEGWTITLYDEGGQQVDQIVTDSEGRANFVNLEPGTYTVCETQQEFWVNSEPGTIDPTYNEPCYEVTVGLGDVENLQFGNWHQTGSLTVTKEVDWFNADPIPDTEFYVCVSGGNLPEPVCEYLEHGESFTVDGLEPGEYTITEPDLGEVWTMTLEGDPVVVFDDETFVTVVNTHEDICLRQSPDPFNDLNHAGSYLVWPFDHGIVQNLSECFGYYVGIASYQIYDGTVATQTIFDYEDGIWVGPGETIDTADTRLIDLPACWAQVDLFYGPAILDFSTGDLYLERLIDSRWINTGVNCEPPQNEETPADPPQLDPPQNDQPQLDTPQNDPPVNDPPVNDPPANDPPQNQEPQNDEPVEEDPPVCVPNPDGDLKHSGSHLNPPFDNGTVTNLSDACTYEVGIASYMVMDGTIATQQLLGSHTMSIGPGETVHLGPVPLAGCTTQVDLFYGYVITDFSGGERYGNRLIDVRWLGSPYCGEVAQSD